MRVKTGGGWRAIFYTLKKSREAGGVWKLWKAMRSKNACKTCALGMGGQSGGMVNEAGHFPEVCKKSFQAMVADMQGGVKRDFFSTYSIAQLQQFSPYQLEHSGRLVEPVVLEKGEQYYKPISWDDAMARIAKRMKGSSPAETFFHAMGARAGPLRHQSRQQLLLLLPSGQRRGDGERVGDGGGDGAARGSRARRHRVPHRG